MTKEAAARIQSAAATGKADPTFADPGSGRSRQSSRSFQEIIEIEQQRPRGGPGVNNQQRARGPGRSRPKPFQTELLDKRAALASAMNFVTPSRAPRRFGRTA